MYTRLNFIYVHSISELIELAFYNLLSKGGLPEDIIKSSDLQVCVVCYPASDLSGSTLRLKAVGHNDNIVPVLDSKRL